MLKRTLMMLSMISIIAGPMLYLSIMDKVGGGAGPSFRMPDFGLPDWVESSSEQVAGITAEMAGDVGSQVYKWKDEAGVWQFSNELPAGVVGVETVEIRSNSSLQAFKPKVEPEPEEVPVEAKQDEPVELELMPTPGRVKQLIEDAQNVQNILDERVKQMDSMSSD